MKYILAFFLFVSSTAFSQVTTSIEWRQGLPPEKGDTIFYNAGKKLAWKDFQGTPDNRSIAAAITSSGFGFSMEMKSRNHKTIFSISVYCFYNKSKSWVKPGMATDYALLHEQHHFDVTYIATCLFIQKLRAASFTLENFSDLVDKIYTESYDELERMQNDYDGQTKNGQLKNIQAEWNIKIDRQLASLAIN